MKPARVAVFAALLLVSGCPAADAASTCTVRGSLPDPTCTPGAVELANAGAVCGGPTRARRHVTSTARREVIAAYGWTGGDDARIDHLIPLELGGANVAANLWPQPAAFPGHRQKDRLENFLHREVCAGRMPLAVAQRTIATDWVAAWRRIPERRPRARARR